MDKNLPITLVDTAEYTISGIVKNLTYPYSQLIYCEKGSGELFSHNSLPIKFKAEDILYISDSRLHGYIAENNTILRMISFTGKYEHLTPDYFHFNGSCVITGCKEFAELFNKILTEKNTTDIQLSVFLYDLIVQAGIKRLEQTEKNITADTFIMDRIKNYIIENYSKQTFSLDNAFIAAGTNIHTADMVFLMHTGMKSEDYLTYFLLENLRNLLFLRPYLILEKCAKTNGFKTYDEFKDKFTKAYNITPEEFVSVYSN